MLNKRLIFILISLSTVFATNAHAQKIIRGVVTDAETGETLPVAHIRVMGTRTGTITNDNGEYVLELETLPALIQASYIGYSSEKLTIAEDTPDELNIALTPSPIMMQAVVVLAEDRAVRIMREVIKRKQEWRKTLETYRAEAYTRVILGNEKSIVSIFEIMSEIYWNRENGPSETIIAKRQTSNIKAEQNFASARMIPNFYDDDIDIVGYKTIAPTHPRALTYYDFKLIGQRQIDSTIVFDISVIPKSKLQPLFVGTISVLDETYAMIKVDLKPGKSILFPPPLKKLDLMFEQQFSNFGNTYWLPVYVKTVGIIKIKLPGLNFPEIKYSQLTRLTDYVVNFSPPDSLMQKKRGPVIATVTLGSETSVTVREGEETARSEPERDESGSPAAQDEDDESVSEPDKETASRNKLSRAFSDSLFAAREHEIIPFTESEQEAYSTIDSTMTMEKAFRPTGALAWLIKDDKGKKKNEELKGWGKHVSRVFSTFRPQFSHSRVDGYNIGLKHKNRTKLRFSYELFGTYLTGREEWSYGGKMNYRWGKSRNGFIIMDFMKGTEPRYTSNTYPALFNSIQTIFGHGDYFDFLRNERQSIEIGYRLSRINTNFSVKINNELHASIDKTTDKNLLSLDIQQRDNPPVEKGRLRSLELSAVHSNGPKVPFGIVGQKRAEFTFEHSPGDLLSSDFSFTRFRMVVDWRFNTFLRRRLMPNALDVQLVGGVSAGELPVQRFGIVDGSMMAFTPFGVLRSLRNHPLEGEHYCVLFWEHNFRTIPFELVGLHWLAEKGVGIIVHGASGRTWISNKRLSELPYTPFYSDRWHSEIGLSVNSLFGILRLDVTKRLDKHGVFAGFGITRFY